MEVPCQRDLIRLMSVLRKTRAGPKHLETKQSLAKSPWTGVNELPTGCNKSNVTCFMQVEAPAEGRWHLATS